MVTGSLFYGFSLVFFLITLLFTVYTLSIAYHWFAYGESRSVSMLSLAMYLVGSAPLFIIMAYALSLM